jgi:ABC-type branched-subunit amino acid transport system ATPase component
MNALTTEKLTKTYSAKVALHDCTVAIPEGSVVALVGPNGAGKTTFLEIADSEGSCTPVPIEFVHPFRSFCTPGEVVTPALA